MTEQPRAELDTLHCQACGGPLEGKQWRWCSRACQVRADRWRRQLYWAQALDLYWKKKAA